MRKTRPFDMVEFLDDEETIQEYMRQVIEDGDVDEILRAVGYVAKARGMTAVAKDAGVSRESLYKALRPDSKPQFETILRVVRALGYTFKIAPIQQSR
ncbi:MAG: putative addiction module antidote protein [Burkholderiales bacterium]|jgi:probable addiction module antidote protein|nr:putative addiction module antidote protein [Burkholderiales bacterium]